MRLLVLVALGALGVPASARADDAAIVDWARGLVIARGVGLADRHAPSPAVARGTSRRGAEAAARATIAKRLPQLPLAGGGTVADKLGEATVKARLDRAVAAAIVLDASPETDGSWRVELAVPIEAVRQALAGPRRLDAGGDGGPPAIVVDGVSAAPAIGWTVGGVAPAIVWVREVPAWAKSAPHARGRAAKPGELAIDGITPAPSTLIVIVARK
jgi:hypothetical protein